MTEENVLLGKDGKEYPLTAKQERFIDVYIETGNASEAYRKSYNCENMKSESIHQKAKELIDNVKVSAKIEQIKRAAREKTSITLESHLSTLERLRNKAEQAENYTAAISAEEKRGKVAGLYVDKIEHVDNGDELEERLNKVLNDRENKELENIVQFNARKLA